MNQSIKGEVFNILKSYINKEVFNIFIIAKEILKALYDIYKDKNK
jgi:hypothetical protein